MFATKYSRFIIFHTSPLAHACKAIARYSKIPDNPVHINSAKPARVSLSLEEVYLLERVSLVKCDTEAGVRVLEDSIAFAEQVLHVPADGVEPMFTVLEDENLSLREDKVTEGDCQSDILRNATLTEEEYFVAPPGNIPLLDSSQPHADDITPSETIRHQ